jgi:hypothetical protein
MLNGVIYKDDLEAFTAKWFNSHKFKSGGLHEKHAIAILYLGTISAFASRHRKTCVEVAGRRTFRVQPDKQKNIELTLA